ncbi:MAG: hypothetical protein LC754_11315 [Acidobacteria bacterium]|nr:hypothetical protein [Acidobacteriota bacterium]
MGAGWQVSAGDFSELLRPASYLLATFASAWALSRLRRRGTGTPAAVAVALTVFASTFLFPLVVLPLLAAWELLRSDARLPTRERVAEPKPALDEVMSSVADDSADRDEKQGRTRRDFASSLLYAALLLSAGAFFFYRDYQTVDAHLARAERSKLHERGEQTIREYRAALKLEDDPHTHKLLGLEFARAGRAEESLAEFLAAKRGGEPDETLSYRIASELELLGHTSEAADAYQKFLQSRVCARTPPGALCNAAETRSRELLRTLNPD